MLNKVRRQFICWAMAAMTAIVVLLALAVNVVNFRMTENRLKNVLYDIAASTVKTSEGQDDDEHGDGEHGDGDKDDFYKNDDDAGESLFQTESESSSAYIQDSDKYKEQESGSGQNPENKNNDKKRKSALVQYGNRFAMIIISDKDGSVILAEGDSLISQEDAEQIAELVEEKENDTGYCYDEFMYYRSYADVRGDVIYVLDCSTDLAGLRSLLWVFVVVGLCGLVLAFFFIIRMSKLAVKPVAISMEKQKQFITNAGHELKTPLSAISANMDILTMDLGKNEWVDGTKRQIRKLRKLVENLISLSKLEEENTSVNLENFSMSNLVKECTDSFAGAAEMAGKTICQEIEPDIYVKADSSTINQLVVILCDNAIKYSLDNDTIVFKLFKEGKNVYFQSVNGWEGNIDKDHLDVLFERFYRGDESRNNNRTGTGSYGLGLSIAKAIAEKNHCQLSASLNEENKIVFTVCFQIKNSD